jgi:hypothetical protein
MKESVWMDKDSILAALCGREFAFFASFAAQRKE